MCGESGVEQCGNSGVNTVCTNAKRSPHALMPLLPNLFPCGAFQQGVPRAEVPNCRTLDGAQLDSLVARQLHWVMGDMRIRRLADIPPSAPFFARPPLMC
jgi:hypothetical protein